MKKALLSIVLISSVMFAQDPIIVSPDTLDYGNILMGNTSSMSFTITANLDQTISITPPSFYSVDTSEIAMTSGETQDIVVTFDPPQIGNYDSQIVLTGSTFGSATVAVNATAVNNLEGSLSGTISAEFSPYEISGDIYVETGNALTIEPGVKLQFTGDYGFSIYGVLIAEGNPDDLITFTTSDTNEFWKGIYFEESESSDISYCDINNVYGNLIGQLPFFTSDIWSYTGNVYLLSISELLLLLNVEGDPNNGDHSYNEIEALYQVPISVRSNMSINFNVNISEAISHCNPLLKCYASVVNTGVWTSIYSVSYEGDFEVNQSLDDYIGETIIIKFYLRSDRYDDMHYDATVQLSNVELNTGENTGAIVLNNSSINTANILLRNNSIPTVIINSNILFKNVLFHNNSVLNIINQSSSVTMLNSIMTNTSNAVAQMINNNGNYSIDYCNIDDLHLFQNLEGFTVGGNNIIGSPMLIDDIGHLDPIYSPCIDAGHPNDYDACMPPGLGTLSADIGMYGGMNNCGTEESNIGGGEPTIITIEDLPQDQGGFVGLQFDGSFYDGGSDIYDITHYSIWRELDTEGREEISYNTSPVGAYYHPNNRENEAWEYIGESPAQEFDIYGYTAPTLADSNYIGQFWSKFLVVAHTTDEAVFFVSLSDSGYSVDNLSPAAPGNFVASIVDTSIILDWDENDVMDLDYYTVYRSTDSELIISEENLLANTTDTLFTDMTAIWNTNYFYQLTCTDYNGNVSGASNFVEAFITVNYAPTIDSIDDIETNEDTPVEIEITVNDENGDSLSITVMSSDENVTPILEGYTLNLNLTANWHGTSEITVTVSDGEFDVTEVFVLNVISVNDTPADFSLISPVSEINIVLTNDNLTDTLHFEWSESMDVDGDSLTYEFESSSDISFLGTIIQNSGTTSAWVLFSAIAGSMETEYVSGTWSVLVTDGIDTVDADNAPFTLTLDGSALAIDPMDLIPEVFALHQNYPNPFNPVTTLRYDLPEQAHVEIMIFDIMGREVKRLVNVQQTAGFKSVVWDGTNEWGQPMSAGLYFYRISAGDFHSVKKMVLLK